MTDRRDQNEQARPPPWRMRWMRLGPFGRDLTVVLAIKLLALVLLWWAFFSHPAARHMSVAVPRVEAHLVPSPNPEQSPHADR